MYAESRTWGSGPSASLGMSFPDEIRSRIKSRVFSRITLYYQNMATKVITFRLPEEKLIALDSVAEMQQRDRSFVINEAVSQYLSLQEYHRSLIEEGIKEADAGKLVDHDKVVNMAAEWVRKAKKRD